MISEEEILARMDTIKNPYPMDILDDLSSDNFRQIDTLLRSELGFGIDRLSGYVGRFVFSGTMARVRDAIIDLYLYDCDDDCDD